MKKGRMVIVLATIGVMVFMGSTMQVARASGDWGGHGPVMMRIGEKSALAGVTEAQRDQLKAVLEKYRSAIEPLIEQLVSEQRTLRSLIRAEGLDEAAIRNQSAKIAAVEADLAVELARLAQESRAILTSDQIEDLEFMETQIDQWINFMIGMAEDWRDWRIKRN